MRKGFALPLAIGLVMTILLLTGLGLAYFKNKTATPPLSVDDKFSSKSELAICTSDYKNSLFPESLTINKKNYPKIGYFDSATGKTKAVSSKSELMEYGEAGDVIDLNIIKKDENLQSYNTLKSIIENSKFEKVNLHGEVVLIVIDPVNKNWQIYTYVPDLLVINIHPKVPGTQDQTQENLITLFNDWFDKTCAQYNAGNANLPATSPEQIDTYTNEEFGFQFEYPSNWKVDSGRYENNATIVLIYSKTEGSIQIWDYSDTPLEEVKTIVTEKKNYSSPVTGTKTEYNVNEMKDIEVFGGKATSIQLQTKITSGAGKQIIHKNHYLIISPKGKNLLLLTRGMQGEHVTEKLIKSFKYLE